MRSFAEHHDIAVKAARAAGDLLRADFHRATGPRGELDKAPADTEAEQLIRSILLSGGGDFGFLGEETGRVPGTPGAPIWVVDPNDGTRDYIKGRRGSSVSIALVWEGRPVLGVVHPFGYPDDDGAMYTAVDGREGVWKNGAPVAAELPARLTDLDVVLVSGGGDRAARANMQCTKPARVMSIPSIAHRLAKVAAGEASATTSLYSPRTWDFAAGHCLVLAAGGALVDQYGNAPVYDHEADGTAPRLFAGSRTVALDLAGRDWDLAFRSQRETSMPIVRLRKGGAVGDPALLARAQGAILGHLIGSSLWAHSFTASQPPPAEGQLGSCGEIAVACARSLIDLASESKSLKRAYASWTESSPLAPDRSMESAAKGQPLSSSLSSIALARVTPLAVWSQSTDPSILIAKIRADTAITHPSPIAGEAAAVLGITLQALLQGTDPVLSIEAAHAFARRSGFSREVIDAVAGSTEAPRPGRGVFDAQDVLALIHAALFSLAKASSFDGALEAALAVSPGSDALPAITGAVMGARFGRNGIREGLRNLVLSCRPMEGFAKNPRPATYWGTDALTLAEALLTAR